MMKYWRRRASLIGKEVVPNTGQPMGRGCVCVTAKGAVEQTELDGSTAVGTSTAAQCRAVPLLLPAQPEALEFEAI